MKQFLKKISVRAALLAGLLTLTAGGMYLSASLTRACDPDALPAEGTPAAPVIVLDAGHGEST